MHSCRTSGTHVCTLAARLFLSGLVTWNMLFSPKLMTCARLAAVGGKLHSNFRSSCKKIQIMRAPAPELLLSQLQPSQNPMP